jgi:hypothetical protein
MRSPWPFGHWRSVCYDAHKKFISEDIAPSRIIILSAYIAQTVLIRKTIILFEDADLERVIISIVDAYQGSENYYSCPQPHLGFAAPTVFVNIYYKST